MSALPLHFDDVPSALRGTRERGAGAVCSPAPAPRLFTLLNFAAAVAGLFIGSTIGVLVYVVVS
jgi:hypothetical protein